MVSLEEYVRGILSQIRESYDTIEGLGDKPGDLEVINREWHRINGLLGTLAARLDSAGNSSDLLVSILGMARYYTGNYYFGRELETMADLYSDDPGRLKAMRLKIIESLQDRRLIYRIDAALVDL